MASRKDQKAQAREQRLAQEREAKAAAQRKQRMQIIGGVAAIAVVVIVVLIIVGTSGSGSKPATSDPHSAANKQAQSQVDGLLTGITQTPGKQIVLGNPNAKVTITEFGDLQCSACDALDTPTGWQSPDAKTENFQGSGTLDSIINKYVKTGKAKLVYRSLETATSSGGSPGMWTSQQAAANAAGLQGKGWQFVELFYLEQGYEKADYVTDAFIEGLAKQIDGLNYQQWYKDWKSNPATSDAVKADNTAGVQLDTTGDSGQVATPTVWVKGPKHQSLFVGNATVDNVSAAVEANL